MARHGGQITLAAHYTGQVLSPITEKGMFRGSSVMWGLFLERCQWLYETGAVLGHAFHDKSTALWSLITEPGREADAMKGLTGIATRRLTGCPTEPDTLFDLYYMTEIREKAGLTLLEFTRKEGQTKLSLTKDDKGATPDMIAQSAVWEGVGFGFQHPDLLEKLWTQTYESFDMSAWAEARSHGVNVPHRPIPIKRQDREQEVLADLANFVSRYRPELLESLDLRPTDRNVSLFPDRTIVSPFTYPLRVWIFLQAAKSLRT